MQVSKIQDIGLVRIVTIIGNNDFSQGKLILRALAQLLFFARREHKIFAKDIEKASQALLGEVLESLEESEEEKILEETLDVLAVAVRIINGEYKEIANKAELEKLIEISLYKAVHGRP